MEHFDVVIVGAGLSGIGAAYHLQHKCPGKRYAILEQRSRLGGTWDLFRYPGIRSDSDMYTLGYSFKPWTQPKAIADGPSILEYVTETARDNGIDQKIRFDHQLKRASWSTADSRWTLQAEHAPERSNVRITCSFLFMCSGYYSYASGYTPEFTGAEAFKGRIVHPQHWTPDIDYAGKRVVVIGSGATAVTLVPSMAKTAAHVTMLQRSPTYIVALPAKDRVADWLRSVLPARLAYSLVRWKNVLFGMYFFAISKWKPELVKRVIIKGVRDALGPDYDVETHFTPRYKPWDQRVCLAPDGDFFDAIAGGQASVVTDHIERFTEHGIQLRSGAELQADLIVTATGLKLEPIGGLTIFVDGQRVELPNTFRYKGMMYSDLPNLASCIGYTNASWTLKCDLTCEYLCRLLQYMDDHHYRKCTPRVRDGSVTAEPWIDFSSGYVQRSLELFPKQGSKRPWRLYQNYALDLLLLRYGSFDDRALEFAGEPRTVGSAAAAQ